MLRTLPSACSSLTSCLTAFLPLPSGSFPQSLQITVVLLFLVLVVEAEISPSTRKALRTLEWKQYHAGLKIGMEEKIPWPGRGCLSPRQMWWIDRGQYLPRHPWEALWWGPACLRWCFCMHHSSGLQEKLLPDFFHGTMLPPYCPRLSPSSSH